MSESLKIRHFEDVQSTQSFQSFEAWMQDTLYAPNTGYYTRSQPVGGLGLNDASRGDFITAPELSPLFAQCLARQCAELFQRGVPQNIFEFGAGTGALAAELLTALAELGYPQVQYAIVDVSQSLRAMQSQRLAPFNAGETRVRWLDALPDTIEGIIIGNEVLDAMPCAAITLRHGEVFERGVVQDLGKTPENAANCPLAWCERSAPSSLRQDVMNRLGALKTAQPEQYATILAHPNYETEINRQSHAFIATLAARLKRGAMIFVDYGFHSAEYYHPQRAGGTLMAHRQHQASTDVLSHAGEADITAHVDFSDIYHAAASANSTIKLAGFATQGRFLLNCGLLEVFTQMNTKDNYKLAQSVHTLVSESEMGELFKAIGFECGLSITESDCWLGFAQGDRSAQLVDTAPC